MILSRKQFSLIAASLWLLATATGLAGANDPITGAGFDRLMEAQQGDLQAELRLVFPERDGYFITGPLDALSDTATPWSKLFHSVRIISDNWPAFEAAAKKLAITNQFNVLHHERFIEQADTSNLPGYRGFLATILWNDKPASIQINTINQTRWLIWANTNLVVDSIESEMTGRSAYSIAVSDYLHALDQGNYSASPPHVVDHGLSESVGLFAPPPDYVIEGYDNYMNYLHGYNSISTDFARGIVAFVPSDSLLREMKEDSPLSAFPNKEAPMLQHEYRKFFSRGGDASTLGTLTRERFSQLEPGEYFFAVGVNRTIRFGREFSRKEVKRIEKETGRKAARANHAFLFPGEPILTAGAFFVQNDPGPRLVEVNAQSGHYFYSNISSTIREDIAIRSDRYLLTLGHFFLALDSLGITYDGVLIRKL